MDTRFYATDLTDAAWVFVAPVLPAARPRRNRRLSKDYEYRVQTSDDDRPCLNPPYAKPDRPCRRVFKHPLIGAARSGVILGKVQNYGQIRWRTIADLIQ
jgi:hypothetical protein